MVIPSTIPLGIRPSGGVFSPSEVYVGQIKVVNQTMTYTIPTNLSLIIADYIGLIHFAFLIFSFC